MNAINTRFAPSPTGSLHIGGIRTALINYIYTKQAKKINSKSKFLLRIDDTDESRVNEKYTKSILEGLEWLQIDWDDNIYFQSKQKKLHQEIAYKLLDNKFAYKFLYW